MHDDVDEYPADEAVLHPDEAGRRKVVLLRLRDELAARGVESVLAGRHVLRLDVSDPRARSGTVDPELHVLSAGCRVTTDGQRYLFTDGAVHAADDLAGAAGHVTATGVPDAAGPVQAVSGSAAPARVIGPGERALRQLIDDGII